MSWGVVINIVAMVSSGLAIQCLSAPVLLLVGSFLQIPGLLLMGPAPWLAAMGVHRSLPVVTGGMLLFYGGLGVQMPALNVVVLQIYERAGFTQKQVAGVSSALFAAISAAGNVLGPPIGGWITDISSFPVTAMVCGVSFVPLVVVPMAIVAVKYYKPPEVGCLARPTAKPEPEERAEESGGSHLD